MTKIRNADLRDHRMALDWAIATGSEDVDPEAARVFHDEGFYNYSTNWLQGGQILERNWAGICAGAIKAATTGYDKRADETLLAFFMRCHVLNTMGDEIEVPDELLADMHSMQQDTHSGAQITEMRPSAG